jgi:hypothetical protein
VKGGERLSEYAGGRTKGAAGVTFTPPPPPPPIPPPTGDL